MAFEDWDKSEDGNIIVRPLAAYDLATVAGMTVLLRLRYLNPGDAPQTPTGCLQLGISGSQLVPLIEDLMRGLQTIAAASRPPNAPRN